MSIACCDDVPEPRFVCYNDVRWYFYKCDLIEVLLVFRLGYGGMQMDNLTVYGVLELR